MGIEIAYVAGANRSGTTLLAQLIGGYDGSIVVGELSGFWLAAADNHPCSCGAPIQECKFWSGVLARIRKDCDGLKLEDWAQLSARVLRTSRSLQLLMMRMNQRWWSKDVNDYVGLMRRTYLAIAQQSGVCTIVDSSKLPPSYLIQGLIEDVESSVIQISRDPRAVVNSERKSLARKSANPELQPPGRSVYRSLMYWSRANVAVRLTGPFARQYFRVEYESIVDNSVEELERIASKLNLGAPTLDRSNLHIAVGNPGRLRGGELVLRTDESWRTELRSLDAWLVRLISKPVRVLLKR